jgi:multiple sugar transport system permease protein
MLPAMGSIALWAYYPLARGTVIAFQDYNVRGFSEWVGMRNFANVLFDDSFWYAMWVSLKYAFFYMVVAFAAPILLAFLLTEVPKGKLVYRTIYYLPAVLTGVIVIFLWKGFYGQYGMINQVCNYVIAFINWSFGWAMSAPIEEISIDWLTSPEFALLFCLLPSIWQGMGPGCLIYLAALKTVPDEIYEAADIDGAGIFQKMANVALPSIKALILINFIGAMIGAMKSGAGFMLAMTGGGPHTPYGQTEVIGLHIFWQAYGYLRFGQATAMAWVLGSLLIGFTVYRLQQLSRMEFRAAGGTGA